MSIPHTTGQYYPVDFASWEAVRDAAIAHAHLRREHIVASVDAGMDGLAADLAPQVKEVYVIDSSAEGLATTKASLATQNNVVYYAADGPALPLTDRSVDAIFMKMPLSVADSRTMIADLVQVLKDGGRLVIIATGEQAPERHALRAAGLVNVLITDVEQAETSQQSGAKWVIATGTRRIAVRQQVQARYGATAEKASARESCCGGAQSIDFTDAVIPLSGSCCSPAPNAVPEVGGAPAGSIFIWETGYSAEQLGEIPVEAAALALGCGNPTAFASLKPGETVLDIGSGGGIDAFFAAQRVGHTGRVIGVDMTPEMLERARATAARAGVTNVEFRAGHAEALPAADETVDVVMSNCVVNLCEDKGLVFEEIHRVLKPGGRLAISDTVLSGALPHALRVDSGSWGACVSGALPEQEYLALVRAAGFREVRGERSLSRGTADDVEIYSLSVSGVK